MESRRVQTPQQPYARRVESAVTFELLDHAGVGFFIRATLSYDPADPFAVVLDLHSDEGPVRWVFGRDLLVEGMFEPTGEGDVLVWPSLDDGERAVVGIELRSPDGVIAGQVLTRDLVRFLQETLDIVPPGSEMRLLDVDVALAHLIGSDVGDGS
jgi:Streptomyces sporulation and cell division protein, SsgA